VRHDGAPSTLYASLRYFVPASHDVESLAEGLWKELGTAISQGRFSYRNGSWHEFAEFEVEFINRALAKDHDG